MTGKRLPQNTEEDKTFGEGLNFAASESYRLLRTNVLFALPDVGRCRVIGITSSLGGEGKSTTALNLAYMLAESGEQTLLLEADLRLPTLTRRLGLEHGPGLSNLLAGLCGTGDVLHPSGIQSNLQVLSAGDIPPNPSELLGAEKMKTLIEEFSSTFKFIIVDLPPVKEVSDALIVSRLMNGILMVVRQNYATRPALSAAMRQLQYVEAKVLGFVVTHSDTQDGKYQNYKKYGYKYGGKAGTRKESAR